MSFAKHTLAAVMVALLVIPVALGAGEPRGLVREGGPSGEAGGGYRKKWAVVVGINYAKADRDPARGDIPTLRNAQNDAEKFKALLLDCFGYRADEVIALVGKDATKAGIEERLENGLCCNRDKVGPDDSVLFYFSGHGYLRKDESGKGEGYLLPADVRMLGKGEPDLSTAIDVTHVLVKGLGKHCQARHKLLILDCCHSGTVFRLDEGVSRVASDDERQDSSLFRHRGFQAIAASREDQQAGDGSGSVGHSPFTAALLRGMRTLPLRSPREPFTTSRLFRAMQAYLEEVPADKQSAHCRSIDGELSGEFHFFPDPDKEPEDFAKEALREEDYQLLMAMVPSTFGNWWMDEAPWFMPSLRLKILESTAKRKSLRRDFDLEELKNAAHDMASLARKNAVGGEQLEIARMRLDHLNGLLGARGGDRKQVLGALIKELEEKRAHPKFEVTDLHYLAALRHRAGQAEQAAEAYKEALQKYEAQKNLNPFLRPLHALCLMDLGILELEVRKKPDEAGRHFREARRLYDGEPPAPFKIYTLCREADALRRERKTGLAEKRMEDALDLTLLLDPNQASLLSAAARKSVAWARMEQCRFKEAARAFEQADRILDQNQRDECVIDRLHVKHGLALIERFQGRDAEALRRFRQLTPEIAEEIRKLDNRQVETPNAPALRQLLVERYLHSLERQADCCLFGSRPDYAEAADDYRRAVRACPFLPEERRDEVQADLLYRRAIALSLCPEAQDPDLAQRLCEEAAAIKFPSDKLPPKLQVSQAIARSLVRPAAGPSKSGRGEDVQKLSQIIEMFPAAERSRIFDRDVHERLMFAYKVLIQRREEWGFSRFETAAHADHLVQLCRSMSRSGTVEGKADADLLHYLRPYYDVAFDAKFGISPRPVKELIEIAWEATRGTLYVKHPDIRPLLVLYCSGRTRYLLLDVPAKASRCFVLDDTCGEKDIREAGEGGHLLPLPGELRRALKGTEQALLVRWHDPVLRLGYASRPQPVAQVSQRVDAPSGDVRGVPEGRPAPAAALGIDLRPDPKVRFPFALQSVLPGGRFEEDVAGLEFRLASAPGALAGRAAP